MPIKTETQPMKFPSVRQMDNFPVASAQMAGSKITGAASEKISGTNSARE